MDETTQKQSPVPPSLQDLWMDRTEACSELRISPFTIGKKIQAGLFETMKYGRYVFLSRKSVTRYLNQFRHIER